MDMRLRSVDTGTHFIVDTQARAVYADLEERGAVNRGDVPDAGLAGRVLESAREYAEYFARPVPGTATPDGKFLVRGPLTPAERAALAGGADVRTERSALEQHLDFFDADLDGRITLAESYRGWRALGFSPPWSLLKAVFAALFFGWPTIDIARIAARRYASTGVFDRRGAVDEACLAPYLAHFDAAGGELSVDQLRDVLRRSSAGIVSRLQFASFCSLCTRLNGNRRVVTRRQFTGLFDGSLLWQAAFTPDASGRRPRWTRPASDVA